MVVSFTVEIPVTFLFWTFLSSVIKESIPRYVRVNTLKKSMEEALEALKDFKVES